MIADLVPLGQLTHIQTGKLDANASSEDGGYPFFTCAREPLKIATWQYDLDAILIAGNGDLNVKHYRGKFDAYQRTYILTTVDPSRLDTRYLYHFMETYLATLREQSIGGIIKYIKMGMLTDAPIPLPPLEEQKRIAAILDQADALRRLRARALDRLNALGQAIFHEMFGDGSYPKRTLKEVGTIATGGTPSTSEDAYYGSDVPFITPGDLNSAGGAKRYLSTAGANVVRTVDAGAALVCCIGATIGKMDMAKSTVAFNQQINAVTWSSEVAPRYGLFALQIAKPEIERQGRGAATTLPILKKSSFEKIEILVPSLDKQSEFSKRIDGLESISATTINEISKLNSLFTSLQHRAFRGEL